jgi:hypothetical protein
MREVLGSNPSVIDGEKPPSHSSVGRALALIIAVKAIDRRSVIQNSRTVGKTTRYETHAVACLYEYRVKRLTAIV